MEALTADLSFQMWDVNVAVYVGYRSAGKKENSEAQCSIKYALLPPTPGEWDAFVHSTMWSHEAKWHASGRGADNSQCDSGRGKKTQLSLWKTRFAWMECISAFVKHTVTSNKSKKYFLKTFSHILCPLFPCLRCLNDSFTQEVSISSSFTYTHDVSNPYDFVLRKTKGEVS